MQELVDKIAGLWGFQQPKILKKYAVWGDRFVVKLQTDQGNHIIKGYAKTQKQTLLGAVRAHEYLKNKRLAPKLIRSLDGSLYQEVGSYTVYVMEFIEGRLLKPTAEDEYKLGQAAARLHSLTDYTFPGTFHYDKEYRRMKMRFADFAFKTEYDAILDSLPDFRRHRQCFVHTDIGPHNALFDTDGKVIFVDLDDAGIGSPYLDFGWPFIMQFVQYNRQTGEMQYEYENAKAFYDGYTSIIAVSPEEWELTWAGAIFMHMVYMPVYGLDGILSMWSILKFGMEQKEKVRELLIKR